MEITKENIPTIIQLIKEYSDHDLEAFNTRTEMFKMMMAMAIKLDKLLEE